MLNRFYYNLERYDGDDGVNELDNFLNRYMPGPLRQWGCDQLQDSFPGAVPSCGCASGDGTT